MRYPKKRLAVLFLTLLIFTPTVLGQDEPGTRRVQLQTFSIVGPEGDDWKVFVSPDQDSVAFALEVKATLGLFGTNQAVGAAAVRMDARYTLHGEMFTREEFLEYSRSSFLSRIQRVLPRGILSSLSPKDSLTQGGKVFLGCSMWNQLERGTSEGKLRIYFPPEYEKRKVCYRFVLVGASSVSLISLGPQSFSFDDMLASFEPIPPVDAHKVGDGRLASAAAAGDSSLVRSLVEQGANVNFFTMEGTPLTLAARGGHVPVVRYLMQKGAVQDPLPSRGTDTPLLAAIDGRQMAMAAYLLDQGANVNATVKNGWTPLMQAVCTRADTAFMVALLNKGATIDAAAEEGTTALFMAAHMGSADIAGFLMDHGASPKSTMANGWTPFLEAADKGRSQVVRAMIERGTDPNEHGSNGWSALMSAAAEGHADVVNLLLEKGASINAADKRGATALHAAISERHSALALQLIDKGADLNARFGNGLTPLMMAASRGDTMVVRILIQHRADLDLEDDEGDTALEMADDRDHEAVVKLLEAAGAKD